jgi:carbamoyl-phosphate synthase large subunit
LERLWDVEIIGVDIDAINITEDREQFRALMLKIGDSNGASGNSHFLSKRKRDCPGIWFPISIRASFTLGGAGASFVHKKEDFDELLTTRP